MDPLTFFFLLGAWFDYVNVSPHYLLSGFSDSPEEGVLSVLWKKYENAFDKVLFWKPRSFLIVLFTVKILNYTFPA